jgi:hypothetical protein
LRIPSLIAARQRPKLGHFNSLLLDLFQIDKDQLPRCLLLECAPDAGPGDRSYRIVRRRRASRSCAGTDKHYAGDFVKVIAPLRTNEYTPHKEYRFNQSSA